MMEKVFQNKVSKDKHNGECIPVLYEGKANMSLPELDTLVMTS